MCSSDLGTPLMRGRYFAESDDAKSQLVVIVNREFAEHYWPRQDPIGKRMRLGTPKLKTPWLTVVGEVGDAKLISPDADAGEQFYQPVAQLEASAGPYASPTDLNGNTGFIVLRSLLPPSRMENVLRATVQSVDPQLPLAKVQTMEQVVSQAKAPRRITTALISIFALAAVFLAVLGIYGVSAFSVELRLKEIGIRMALGSPRGRVMSLVVLSGIKLAGVGCILGFAGAVGTSNIVRSFLFQVSPFDPFVIVSTVSAALALALVASAFPAYQAASINPGQVLRQ